MKTPFSGVTKDRRLHDFSTINRQLRRCHAISGIKIVFSVSTCWSKLQSERLKRENPAMVYSLEELDDLALIHITRFLDPEDIVRLGLTCRRIHSLMPRIIPTTEEWKGKDFFVSGPYICPNELYFDGPVLSGSVKKLVMSVLWKDQGYGNKKGEIFVKLMRPEAGCSPTTPSLEDEQIIEIAERRRLFGIAEHYWKREHTVISDHPVVSKARPGDFYRFMRYVGGGGGHELIVRNFRVVVTGFRIIYHKKDT